jgi:hypothetical protein
MKKLMLLFVLVAAQVSLFAQTTAPVPQLPTDAETKLITYTEVVNTPGLTKAELYKRANAWFKKYYKNPADVIKENDSANTKIAGIHRYKLTKDVKTGKKDESVKNDAGMASYSISIMCKDGKYKYEITKINWKQQSYYPIEKWYDKKSPSYDPMYDSFLAQTDAFMKSLVEDLKKGMAESGVKPAKDW